MPQIKTKPISVCGLLYSCAVSASYFYSFFFISTTEHRIVIRGDTYFSLFNLFAILFHLFLFSSPAFQLSPPHSLSLSLSLFLTLTLSDSVSMLSRSNPPLRGVKALPHTQSVARHPVRYRSTVPLTLMGFFTPKHLQSLMHRTASDGVTCTDTHTHTHSSMTR